MERELETPAAPGSAFLQGRESLLRIAVDVALDLELRRKEVLRNLMILWVVSSATLAFLMPVGGLLLAISGALFGFMALRMSGGPVLRLYFTIITRGMRLTPEERSNAWRHAREIVRKKRVDLNHASREELMLLPGIGKKRAEAIIKRRRRDYYDNPDELTEMRGVNERMVESFSKQVRASSLKKG